MSFPQSVHGFGLSIRGCSALPPNWRDDLFWPSGWFSHAKCTSACDAYWIGPTVNHDTRLSIVISHKLSYYLDSQPWEDIELMSKLTRGFKLWIRP